MSERTEGKEIYKRMAAILADFPAVAKSQSGEGISYSYRGIDDALAALHPLLAKHRVFMTCRWQNPEWSERGKTRSGAMQFHVQIAGALVFAADDGSCLTVGLLGEGMDTRDKALMKAQANAMKYAVWYTFCVPTAEKKDSEAYDGDTDEVYEKAPAKPAAGPHVILRMVRCKTMEEYDSLKGELNKLRNGERKIAQQFSVLHRQCLAGKRDCTCEAELAKEVFSG